MKEEKTLNKPIVLVGMMGAGKTHIGGTLADALALEFNDTDHLIEEKAGMSVPEIFEHFGEAKFRESEHKTIIEALDNPPCVLATGGGALMNAKTLEELKQRAVMVWIDVESDVLWSRVKDCKNRPLLQAPDARQRLEDLLEERKALYEQAHIHVQNNKGQASDVVAKIIELL